MASTFAATNIIDPDDPLANSYIADTGADSHIINCSRRYFASRKALQWEIVASGKDHYPIESIGTATDSAQGPNGPVELILNDVAFVPGYFTNIVSISKLASKNIHMDSGDSMLYIKDNNERRDFVYCPRKNGHWILSIRELVTTSVFSHLITTKQVNSEIYNEEFFNWEDIYTVGNSEVSNRQIRDVQDTARKDKRSIK
ncbi:hypothetical protein K3495_g14744 [Podosphaera aphanis]|nr:hypothetical protein K3495_g14744 [Podosphaera aphanis]